MLQVNTSVLEYLYTYSEALNMSAKTGIGAYEGTQYKLAVFLIIYRLFFYLLWYSLRVSGVFY
jgi:hypothetical protein